MLTHECQTLFNSSFNFFPLFSYCIFIYSYTYLFVYLFMHSIFCSTLYSFDYLVLFLRILWQYCSFLQENLTKTKYFFGKKTPCPLSAICETHNRHHIISEFFDISLNFSFATSETDYYSYVIEMVYKICLTSRRTTYLKDDGATYKTIFTFTQAAEGWPVVSYGKYCFEAFNPTKMNMSYVCLKRNSQVHRSVTFVL